MAHVVGTVQLVSPNAKVGPDSGQPPTTPNTFTLELDPGAPASGNVKFVLVHFQNVSLPANNRLEVDLGYGTDVFTSASGTDFWSRPVNVAVFAGDKVAIRYITDGAATGGAEIDRFARGEQQTSGSSISNCDPFLLDANYVEPTFDPALFCSGAPNWENTACVTAAGDIRKAVAPSVGMIVHVDLAEDGSEIVSSFSATLVGPDLVLTAAQKLALAVAQVQSASIIFNYETTCAGARPPGYTGRFHKVKRVVSQAFFGAVDYALLQIAVPPGGGLGVAPVTMRPDLPAAAEQVFCIHHPEGAVKRLSAPHPGFQTVATSNANAVTANFDVASGSTGAGVFDLAGRIVGVLSTGTACSISFFPTASALQDVANPPGDPTFRDVMIVFDRSGSMSLDAGTGRAKIEEARDAASLFVQLVQKNGGNTIGLVSFSATASAPVDFALAQVNDANNLILVGPPPFSGGKIGALVPNGGTSIGAGLIAARDQLAAGNVRTILLLTDGLQNIAPFIGGVTGLDGIDINTIGFGEASGLDGALLTDLSNAHNGVYMRAGDGLALKKYFALAFGNIFTSGALLDPEAKLAATADAGAPIKFQVCGEDAITIVAGWDRPRSALAITVKTPGGATITTASPGVEHATGRTWAFLRIKLPRGAERNGTWTATVRRAGGSPLALRYFVTVIAGGGAKLRRWPGPDKYFTGDAIEPFVQIAGRQGVPEKAKVALTVTRPDAAIGNILTGAKLRPAATQRGDTLPARHATLQALEKSAGRPLVGTTTHRFDLVSETALPSRGKDRGLFGIGVKNLLAVEGTYTFHAVATYGKACVGTRETQWSVHVDPGVDQAKSDVRASAATTRPDKKRALTFTIIPRDRFGNHIGPGRADIFRVTGAPGTTLSGALRDNGDGSYSQAAVIDAGVRKPEIVLSRPQRRVTRK